MKLLGLAALLAIVAAVVIAATQWPDIQRYMKIRSM
jgi:uncharacterized membrane protein